MAKRYTVIYTDYSSSCYSYAAVYGTYKTKEEAREAMEEDIVLYSQRADCPVTMDKYNLVMVGDGDYGCQWQILEMEV